LFSIIETRFISGKIILTFPPEFSLNKTRLVMMKIIGESGSDSFVFD